MNIGSTPPATIAAFKALFFRDFTYGDGPTAVMDRDIANALNTATSLFNPALFSTQLIGTPPMQTSESLNAYLYLTAHFLVTSLQAVGGFALKAGAGSPGIHSQGEGILSGKGGGGLNASYTWPSMVTESATLFQLTKTAYGMTYLQILVPKLVGNAAVAHGETANSSDFFLPGGGVVN